MSDAVPMTVEQTEKALEAAALVLTRANEHPVAHTFSHPGNDALGALRDAMNPSPLPSDDDLRDMFRPNEGDHRGTRRVFVNGMRLVLERFGHQEGCGEGCAACDVMRWVEEMESR